MNEFNGETSDEEKKDDDIPPSVRNAVKKVLEEPGALEQIKEDSKKIDEVIDALKKAGRKLDETN